MKAERNEDGYYSLVGMTGDGVIGLYQFVRDMVDMLQSSGDELDENELKVYDKIQDLFDLWKYHEEGGF